jgi:hypothetical protein
MWAWSQVDCGLGGAQEHCLLVVSVFSVKQDAGCEKRGRDGMRREGLEMVDTCLTCARF